MRKFTYIALFLKIKGDHRPKYNDNENDAFVQHALHIKCFTVLCNTLQSCVISGATAKTCEK